MLRCQSGGATTTEGIGMIPRYSKWGGRAVPDHRLRSTIDHGLPARDSREELFGDLLTSGRGRPSTSAYFAPRSSLICRFNAFWSTTWT